MFDGWSLAFVIGVVVLAVGLALIRKMRSETWGGAPDATLKKMEGDEATPHIEMTDPPKDPDDGPKA